MEASFAVPLVRRYLFLGRIVKRSGRNVLLFVEITETNEQQVGGGSPWVFVAGGISGLIIQTAFVFRTKANTPPFTRKAQKERKYGRQI